MVRVKHLKKDLFSRQVSQGSCGRAGEFEKSGKRRGI